MTTHESDALLHVLGTIDGHLEAQSFSDPAADQADLQSKAAYASDPAVRVRNPGDEAAIRKRFERAVKSLATSGLIGLAGKAVALTPEADTTARRLAGLPCIDDTLVMDLLAVLVSHKARWTGGWVSEPSLCGMSPVGDSIIGAPRVPDDAADFLCYHLAPLLAHRLVVWRPLAGWDGLFLYQPTPAGRALAHRGDAARWFKAIRRPRPIDAPAPYCAAWQTTFEARRYSRPARPNLVMHLDPLDAPRGAR